MSEQSNWEEQFDEAFGDLHEVRVGVPHENHDYPEAPSVKTDSPLINPTNKFVRYIGHDVEEEIKRFIASQIEKTRRETHEEDRVAAEKAGEYLGEKAAEDEMNAYAGGFKAGIRRAIELVPDVVEPPSADYDEKLDAYRERMLENLKKEIEK